MQNEFEFKKNTGFCAVCQKPVPVRDVRDVRQGKPVFCGRAHAEIARYATRYRGTGSGPLDRPSTAELIEKTKWKG